MDSRFVFSALAGVLCVVMIFASVTTVRYVNSRSVSVVAARPN
jgi:hypothetical protein